MLLSRATRFAALGISLIAGCSLMQAQTSEAGMAALTGGVSPRVAIAKDIGETNHDRRLESMSLRFALTPRQQAALTQLLSDQQNPASSRYHQWLTPEQFRIQFGLSAERLSAATSWLAAQGFTVTEVSRGGLFVRFSGTVAQAERAFATQIHNVSLRGETHFANVTAPVLPTWIAAMTTAVTGLDDFRPKSHATTRITTDDDHPDFTTAAGTHYLAPGDFYTIYNETPLLSSVTGTGVMIAVVGQTDINANDLAAFQTAAGLTAKQPVTTVYGVDPGYTTSADLNETEMDLEWANAVAPGASILYVNSTDAIEGSLTEAIDNNIAPIITSSYGACEADLGTNALAYFNVLLQMGSAEGITMTAATGDSGATDCDVNVGSAVNGLAVDFPASSPYVTAIGGTEFSEGSGSYWSATNSATGSSANQYIPEVVWNDDNGAGLSASGGGASAYFSKPTWQTGTGVPTDFSRDVPDVALAASINHDGYLICTGSNCTSGFSNASGGYEVSGGTSAAAPAFAGLLALVEQETGARLGNANPVLYALAGSSFAANVFYDVTSGTNASPCTAGTPNCDTGGTIGFAATAGYDQATGWGSVNAYNLVNSWTSVTPVAVTGGVDPTITNIAGSLTTAVVGTPIMFTVTVASGTTESTAVPTGSAQITVDGVAFGSAITLSGGTGAYTLDTSSLSTGTHTVQATYLGDSIFSGSKGAFRITITAATFADFALTPTTANVTVKSGAIASPVQFSVSSLDGFTGSVAFTASLVAPLAAQSSFSLNPVTLTSSVTSAPTSFTLLAYTDSSQVTGKPHPGAWYRAGSGVVLAGLLLVFLPRRRKLPSLIAALFLAAMLGISGCGPAATPPAVAPTTTGTPVGTYTVLIQATATINSVVTEHTATITYVVQ